MSGDENAAQIRGAELDPPAAPHGASWYEPLGTLNCVYDWMGWVVP